MRLIMGGINQDWLHNFTSSKAAIEETSDEEGVLAAVAYATDSKLLFDWCLKHKKPLKFYGRLDEGVAVGVAVLDKFLKEGSPDFVCRLIRYHHAKVIWWKGYGIYIGSANLTQSAWGKNIEVGCFFMENEINDQMREDIGKMFTILYENSVELTDELLGVMKKQSQKVGEARINAKADTQNFWNNPNVKKGNWLGLDQVVTTKRAKDRKEQAFLEEWRSALQDLRDIGRRVSQPENRPLWINNVAPSGAQADQFLHAHYYQRTFDGGKAIYEEFFEKNKNRRESALIEAVDWWRKLSKAPSDEDKMLNETAPFLQNALSEQNLGTLKYSEFNKICFNIHAIRFYSRRASSDNVDIHGNKISSDTKQKVKAHSKKIWNARLPDGVHVKALIQYILYGGPDDRLPERLWQAVKDPEWKIDGLGFSALGELVGWALPNRFPPRNKRTSKALRSLGYDVTVDIK